MLYIRAKIEEKLRFKDAVSHDDGTNDFAEWKRLGIFIVHWRRLPDPLVRVLRQNRIDVYAGEVLELHIPPANDVSFEDLRQSRDRLKEYLYANSRDKRLPRYIYGVSYLAKISLRWGFQVIDLPDVIKQESGSARLLQDYKHSRNPARQKLAEKFNIADIQLCFTTVDEFLSK